jgi:hypothetical protein
LAVVGLFGVGGCSQQLSGDVEPGVDLRGVRTYYVVKTEETKVTTAIEAELRGRGFTASSGPETAVPASADCKVLATDKWVWDMTMYPLEVKVEMVDARTGKLMASGRSYRTSMVRKSPQEMVKEIFDKIFGTGVVKGG